jgi:opacity protein-like surface antigen
MTRSTIAATLAALALSTAPVAAQTPAASSTKGFFIGAHLNGSSIEVDEEEFEDDANGGGLGFQLGYGLTPQFALFVDGTAAQLEDEVMLGHIDLGVRYAFTSPTRRWVPSVEAAFTGRVLSQDDADIEGETADLEVSGGGFTFGIGLQYYTSPSLAFGAGFKWTGGEFSSVKVDNVTIEGFEIDATSTRFNVGVTWFPGARR